MLQKNLLKKLLTIRSFSSLPSVKLLNVSDRSNGVFSVELNRPAERNSFTLQLWKELSLVFNYLSDYSGCRVIILSGAGKSFCAGIDLKNGITEIVDVIKNDSLDIARKSRILRKIIKTCQDSYTSVEKCNKPVISSIHSHCVGAGISLVSCSDIRYAVNDSTFSIREVDIGIAADVGILQRLHMITGNDSWGREIAFTARNFSASEALSKGFVSRVFESRDDCLNASFDLANQITSKSPIAVQGTKLAMNYVRNHGVDDSIDWILNWNQSQLQTDDIVKNIMAKISKQKVVFDDV